MINTIKLICSWLWTIGFVLMIILLIPFVVPYSWLKYKFDTKDDKRRFGFDNIT